LHLLLFDFIVFIDSGKKMQFLHSGNPSHDKKYIPFLVNLKEKLFFLHFGHSNIASY
jgi:hypothetical protein